MTATSITATQRDFINDRERAQVRRELAVRDQEDRILAQL